MNTKNRKLRILYRLPNETGQRRFIKIFCFDVLLTSSRRDITSRWAQFYQKQCEKLAAQTNGAKIY